MHVIEECETYIKFKEHIFLTNSEHLPRANHPIMKSVYYMEHITFAKTHLSFVRLVVIEMGSAINTKVEISQYSIKLLYSCWK